LAEATIKAKGQLYVGAQIGMSAFAYTRSPSTSVEWRTAPLGSEAPASQSRLTVAPCESQDWSTMGLRQNKLPLSSLC